MKKFIILKLFTTITFLNIATIYAETKTATADIEVFNTLTVTQSRPILFGTITPGTVESKAVTNPDPGSFGTSLEYGDAIVISQGFGGAITFEGDPGILITVSSPNSATITNGIDTLNVSIDGDTSVTTKVGYAFAYFNASVIIPANASLGSYYGTFLVNYSY